MRYSKSSQRSGGRQAWMQAARWAAPMTLACAAGVAHAQFRASIQGTVTDPSGAVIPNATLTLKDLGTNRVVTTKSNQDGVYNLNGLPPDSFNLTVAAPGFKQKVIDNLTITPDQATALNLQLDLGESSTTVTVSGNSIPAVDTETASLQGTVSSNDIQHLPSTGRDVFQLAQLAPGGFGDGSRGGGGSTNSLPGTQGPGGSGGPGGGISATENGPQVHGGGGQYETNAVSIDGISVASAVWGGTSIITPNEDAVDSLKVTTSAYDAEIGRFSGSQLEVTSKSGTNQVHGSAFIRLNRPGLNAYQRYNGPGSLAAGTAAQRGLLRETDRYNQIGGSLGGPLWKDHLFGFFSYETVRNNSNTTANGWYETPQFDALTGGPIANKFITFAGHSPVNASLISETCTTAGFVEGVNCRTVAGQGLDIGRPLTVGVGKQDLGWTGAATPGTGGDGSGSAANLDGVADIAHYQTSSLNDQTVQQFSGRADANVTQKDRVSFTIFWVPQSTQAIEGPARDYNLWNHTQVNEAYTIIWNHTFSSSLLNEARVNDAGWRWNEVSSNPQEPFGLPSANIDTIGGLSGSNAVNYFGAPGPSIFNQHTYTYRDVLTKVIGNHNIRTGAEVTRLYYLNNPTYSARPSYQFYNIWDFLNDAPHSEAGQFNRFTGIPDANRYDNRENLWGAFIQDDWKARPNLTFNLGLRYSYFDSLYAKQDNLPAVRFGAGSSLFTGMSITRGGHLWNPQPANLGPQFGFNWAPEQYHNKLVVRGGYGLNYNQAEIAITGNFAGNPGDVVSPSYTSGSPSAINSNIVYAVPDDAYSLFGYPSNPHTLTAYDPTTNIPTTSGLSLTAYPTNYRTAYTHHYSLDTQFDVGKLNVITVGYQGSTAHHLISQTNLYLYGAYHGIGFNPQIVNVDYYGDYAASNYNALLVSYHHQMAYHFELSADFTYAKSMDDNSGPYEEDPYGYDNRYARGRSDYNFGKALKVYGVWQPKLFSGHHEWLERVAGGWSISGIYNFHTGFPWTPVYNGPSTLYYDQSGYGSTLRPAAYNGNAGKNYANDLFKPGSDGNSGNFPGGGTNFFAVPTYTTGTFPNVGSFPVPGIARNSFDGPRYMDLDATVAKNFALPHVRGLGESSGLEIRADAFNLFNLTNLDISQINNQINAPSFGVIRGALGARTVNVQARFNF